MYKDWVPSSLFKVGLCNWHSLPGVVLAFLLTLPSLQNTINLPSQQNTINSSRPHSHFRSRRTVQNSVSLATCHLRPRVNILVKINLYFNSEAQFLFFFIYLNICFTMKALSLVDNSASVILSFLKDFNEHLSDVGRGYRTICLHFGGSLHFLACVDHVPSMKRKIAVLVLTYVALVISLIVTKSALLMFTKDR